MLRAIGALFALALVAVATLHVRRQFLMHRPVPPLPASDTAASTKSFYFAYGTNMSVRYLYNARDIRPLYREPASVANYEVEFLGPGINSLEPAFAYLVPAQGKVSYGVLYGMTTNDLKRIGKSEGTRYEWTTVPVMSSDGKAFQAQTLVRPGGPAAKPSRRYLNIVIEGAAENGLPADYVSSLRREPSVYVPVASDLMGDILLAFVMEQSGKCSSLLVC